MPRFVPALLSLDWGVSRSVGDFSGNYRPRPQRPVIVQDEYGRELCRYVTSAHLQLITYEGAELVRQ